MFSSGQIYQAVICRYLDRSDKMSISGTVLSRHPSSPSGRAHSRDRIVNFGADNSGPFRLSATQRPNGYSMAEAGQVYEVLRGSWAST